MITIPPDEVMIGIQLPIQALSAMFAQPWEREAGPEDLARIARVCEDAGYDYVGVCDHVGVPNELADSMGTFWMDPVATLAWLGAQTERIALLTHVYVVAYRHPLVAAKQFATLDHLTGGRLIAGIGAGHLEAEFDALDIDFAGRGALVDESIAALTDALENEFVDGLGARPRPVQSPRPPIWVGGSSAPAVRRAARLGDGWLPQGPATAEQIATLRRLRDEAGRADEPFAIGHLAPPVHLGRPDDATDAIRAGAVVGSADQLVETLLAGTPEGVNQIQVRVVARTVEEHCEQLQAVAQEVLPDLRAERSK